MAQRRTAINVVARLQLSAVAAHCRYDAGIVTADGSGPLLDEDTRVLLKRLPFLLLDTPTVQRREPLTTYTGLIPTRRDFTSTSFAAGDERGRLPTVV